MENVPGIGKGDDQIELPPGFRFHPTDEELISHYLHKKVMNVSFSAEAIGEVDLNKSEPWELPRKAKMGENEWYFFCLKDRKYPTGLRTNRATEAGYWKATGKDKEIYRGKSLVGMKKTLVFYRGRAPRGEKMNWVMHEFRLDGKFSRHNLPETAKNEWVISRVFEKPLGGKKTHISGLTGVGSEAGSSLPPLMDSPPQTTNAKPVVESAHVPCFSSPILSATAQSIKDHANPPCASTSPPFPTSPLIPRFSILGSVHSADPLSVPLNLQYPSPMLLEEHSVLRALLENPNLKTETDIITATQQAGPASAVTNPRIPSVLSSFELGPALMFHDQQHHHHQQAPPSTSAAGPSDLDFIWNY